MFADMFTAMSDDVVKIAIAGTPAAWADITPLSERKIEKVFGPLGDYQPKYGSLKDVLVENISKDQAKMKSIITQGLIQGRGVQEVSREIRDRFGIITRNAEKIFITENHRNRALGDWANYNQSLSLGLEVWREIVSTLDDRTRAQSGYVDGRIDKDGTGFIYPNGNKYKVPGSTGVAAYDIRDRERTIQVIPGMGGDEQRRGRDPVTGENEVFSYKNFDEWAKEKNLIRNRYGELLTIG